MKITVAEVNYIAKLSKLSFSDEQAEKMSKEFDSILTHFESIDKFDLSDIQLDVLSEDLKPVLRSDETSVFKDKKKLFQNVKSLDGTSIKVPRILE